MGEDLPVAKKLSEQVYGQDRTVSTYVEGWDEEAPAADSWQGSKFKEKRHRLGEEQKSKYGTVWEKKKESKYNTDK